MVSRLDDDARARHLAHTLHRFLKEDLQLPLAPYGSRKASVEAFGALMGVHRASNPLFPQRKAAAQLRMVCPLTRRFPTTFTGKLTHYEDCAVALKQVIDKGGAAMDEHKMWRLILWIFLGDGGYMHQAWNHLQGTPCGASYRNDVRQPLEVLRWVIHAVHTTGGLMRVIGSDGLDKKSRLAKRRILWLCDWHRAVPRFVEKFHEGGAAFRRELCSTPGLKGDLTQKEILILLSASKYKSLAKVGQEDLPFGMGARNGAKAFLHIPQFHGVDNAKRYHEAMGEIIPQLEGTIKRLFPALPKSQLTVTVGDIEPVLCGAFIYSKMVEKLRRLLPKGRLDPDGEASNWEVISQLGTPAGFIPHTLAGKPERGPSVVPVPLTPYARFRLREVPPKRDLNKRRLLKMWGPAPEVPQAAKRRRTA